MGDNPASVLQRRRELEGALGVRTDSLRFMHQTHSAHAAAVAPDRGVKSPHVADRSAGTAAGVISADALVSDDGSVPLAVMVADCVPVVVSAAGSSGATAVIHAGRQGVLDGIVHNTVALLRTRGAQELTAWIGPAICGECYEVPAALRDEVSSAVPEAWSTTRWKTPGLNLPAAVRAQLEQQEVQVLAVGGDTAHSGSHQQLCTLANGSLYSHRRSPASGRFAGLIWNR